MGDNIFAHAFVRILWFWLHADLSHKFTLRLVECMGLVVGNPKN